MLTKKKNFHTTNNYIGLLYFSDFAMLSVITDRLLY
jgi:hypothetical protein